MKYSKYGLFTLAVLVAFFMGRMGVPENVYENNVEQVSKEGNQTSIKHDANIEKNTSKLGGIDQVNLSELISQLDVLDLLGPKPVPTKDYNSAHYERTIVKKTQDITAEEIAIYNQHHVIPFNPIVDVVCHETHTPEGASSPESECINILERPNHPFSELANDELIELARTDPVASLVLARNVEQPDQRIYWSLRASALSSKSGPLVILANRNEYSYALVRHFAVVENDYRGIVVRLALENVITTLNDPRGNVAFWEGKMQEFSPEKFVSNLKESKKLTAAMLQSMVIVQGEVGRSDILEGLKNA